MHCSDTNSAQSNSNKKFELKAADLNSKDYLDFQTNSEYKNPNCTIFASKMSNLFLGYSSLGLSSATAPSTYSSYSSGYASYPQAGYTGYSSTFGMNPASGYDQDPLNSYGFVSGLTAAAAAISASSGAGAELPLKPDLLPSVSR